jgi:hypothetical protein
MNPDFNISNKLEVLPGNVIMLPGCEPTSSMTVPVMDINMFCPKTFIRLVTALRVIPEAQVVIMPNTGDTLTRKYFVLPSGPPPQVGSCCFGGPDWYKILREAAFADEPVQEPQTQEACGFGGYMSCGETCK